MKIPFMKPPITGSEQNYFNEAWESGWHGGDEVYQPPRFLIRVWYRKPCSQQVEPTP